MLWPLFVFYLTVMKIPWTRAILLPLHLWRPAHFPFREEIEDADTDEATDEETEAKETPARVYKGPRVISGPPTMDGLVTSIPTLGSA